MDAKIFRVVVIDFSDSFHFQYFDSSPGGFDFRRHHTRWMGT